MSITENGAAMMAWTAQNEGRGHGILLRPSGKTKHGRTLSTVVNPTEFFPRFRSAKGTKAEACH